MPIFNASRALVYQAVSRHYSNAGKEPRNAWEVVRFTRPVRPDEARRFYLAHLYALDIDPADLSLEPTSAEAGEDDVHLEAPEPEVLPVSTYPLPTAGRPAEEIRGYIEQLVGHPFERPVSGSFRYSEAGWALIEIANAAEKTIELAARGFHDSAANEVRHVTAAFATLRKIATPDADAITELVDRLLELREALLIPPVGGAATLYGYSDADAYTVLEVRRRGREVVLRQDRSILLNSATSGEADALTFSPGGFCGHTSGVQRWSYEADPEGEIVVVSRRDLRNGQVKWVRVGTPTGQAGRGASFGKRGTHYDFNF